VLQYKLRQDTKKTVIHVTISPKYEHVILHYINKIYTNCSRSAQFIAKLATYT